MITRQKQEGRRKANSIDHRILNSIHFIWFLSTRRILPPYHFIIGIIFFNLNHQSSPFFLFFFYYYLHSQSLAPSIPQSSISMEAKSGYYNVISTSIYSFQHPQNDGVHYKMQQVTTQNSLACQESQALLFCFAQFYGKPPSLGAPKGQVHLSKHQKPVKPLALSF